MTLAIDKLGEELFPDVYNGILERRLKHGNIDKKTDSKMAQAAIRINFYYNDIAPIKEYTFIEAVVKGIFTIKIILFFFKIKILKSFKI